MKHEDASAPLRYAARSYCPRKLKRGWVKRYMGQGPLIGYMLSCPSCGFIELHLNEKVAFVEADPPEGLLTEPDAKGEKHAVPIALVGMGAPAHCMACGKSISIEAGGMMHARSG